MGISSVAHECFPQASALPALLPLLQKYVDARKQDPDILANIRAEPARPQPDAAAGGSAAVAGVAVSASGVAGEAQPPDLTVESAGLPGGYLSGWQDPSGAPASPAAVPAIICSSELT